MSSYNDAKNYNLPWITAIKTTLEKYDMLPHYTQEYPDKPNFVHEKMFQCIRELFYQEGFETMKAENSKLRTYAIFKTEKGRENYLTDIKNIEVRKQVTKFRLSNHQLRIETGRHDQIPVEQRLCPFCQDTTEDELHFLLVCPTYNCMRSTLLTAATSQTPELLNFELNQKFEYIMKNIDNNSAKFISNCLELRSFLIANHKEND